MTLTLNIVRLAHAADLALPAYETDGSAGMDLRAAIGAENTITLRPGERGLIATGLSIELPARHEGQVRPRSGLAVKSGITVLNAPGTIDEDYRGEVKVPLINLSDVDFVIEHGMRIAQLVIAPVARVIVLETEELTDTDRGAGGFGSTGV